MLIDFPSRELARTISLLIAANNFHPSELSTTHENKERSGNISYYGVSNTTSLKKNTTLYKTRQTLSSATRKYEKSEEDLQKKIKKNALGRKISILN